MSVPFSPPATVETLVWMMYSKISSNCALFSSFSPMETEMTHSSPGSLGARTSMRFPVEEMTAARFSLK